jgi:hypothetical protein
MGLIVGPLPVSDIVQVNVSVAAAAVASRSFNQALIVGDTAVIPTYGANPRLRQYANTDEMLSDGFTNTDPEFIAAEIYFSQQSNPQFVWIGRQDDTAIESLAIAGRTVLDGAMSSSVSPTHLTSATAAFVVGDVGKAVRVIGAGAAGADLVTTVASISSGTVAVLTDPALTTVTGAQSSIGDVGQGYKAGEFVNVVQGIITNATPQVLTVGQSGVVLTLGLAIGNQGSGYTPATGLSTTGGSGTGLKVNILTVGETLVQAVESCALANNAWYGFMCIGETDQDRLDLAAYSTANWETAFYFTSTDDSDIANGVAGNIALQMKALKYLAVLSYNTTQSNLYPNNIYAAAAVLGVYCGLNTGLAGSYFTLNLKQLVGIAPEPLTQSQYNAIKSANCNTCATFGPYDGFFVSGVLPSAAFFDQYLFRAMLVNQIQTNLMNLLISVPAIPQTNPGEQQLIGQVNNSCANLASIGYIAPGVWSGVKILALSPGDPVPLGYKNQAQPYSAQSAGDRAARKAMPIYCAIIEAGAVHSVLVQVNVEV